MNLNCFCFNFSKQFYGSAELFKCVLLLLFALATVVWQFYFEGDYKVLYILMSSTEMYKNCHYLGFGLEIYLSCPCLFHSIASLPPIDLHI